MGGWLQKTLVNEVFASVASRYDYMNDLSESNLCSLEAQTLTLERSGASQCPEVCTVCGRERW